MEEGKTKIISTKAFKLKDKPSRQHMAISLVDSFGFIPEIIVIEKVPRMHDTVVVHAIVPDNYELPKPKDGTKN